MRKQEKFFISKFVLVSILVLTQATQDYCSIAPDHALCGDTGLGPSCSLVLEQGLNHDEMMEILKIHNEMRLRVAREQESRGSPGPQPPAANMQQMFWDEELQRIAQSHANKCVFAHDCNDCRKTGRFSVGQNIFTSSSSVDVSRVDLKTAISSFYDEVADMDSTSLSNYKFSPATGHYTQIVWASTSRIGCGYIKHKQGNWYKTLLTCNYGPAGNVIGKPIYKVGESCSACPERTSCSPSYPGLCMSEDAEGDFGSSSAHLPIPQCQLMIIVFALIRLTFNYQARTYSSSARK